MHEPIDSFENRLRKALNYRGMKPIDLANKLDLNKGIISQYLKGKYYPKQKRLSEIASIVLVSKWLGHANISTTLNIYSHLYTSELEIIKERINNI